MANSSADETVVSVASGGGGGQKTSLAEALSEIVRRAVEPSADDRRWLRQIVSKLLRRVAASTTVEATLDGYLKKAEERSSGQRVDVLAGMLIGAGDYAFAIHCKAFNTLLTSSCDTASRLATVCCNEVQYLSEDMAFQLVAQFKETFVRGVPCSEKALDVFSKLCQRACVGERRDELVGSLLDCEWHPDSVSHVLLAIRDVGLPGDIEQRFMDKALAKLDQLEGEQLISAVQGVLAAVRQDNFERVFECVTKRFVNLEAKYLPVDTVSRSHLSEAADAAENDSEEAKLLIDTSAVALLSLLQSIRYRADFGATALKLIKLKSGHLALEPFSLALLLGLVQLPRFKEKVLTDLKALIKTSFKERELCANSIWLREYLPAAVSFRLAFERLFSYRSAEWSQVLGVGLCELGFALLDSHVTCVSVVAGRLLADDAQPPTAAQSVCLLGKWLVEKCFERRDAPSNVILERLLDEIEVHSAKESALYYIELLAELIQREPVEAICLRESMGSVLEHLRLLDSRVATALLRALLPVIKATPDLRDKLLLTLKRAMFDRSIESRKVAVGGFLLFLKHFKLDVLPRADSDARSELSFCSQLSQSFPTFSSQVIMDVTQTSAGAGGRRRFDQLCLEAIGCLRRCFTQPAVIRSLLYKGLCDAAKNEQLTLPVVDLLFDHLQLFVEASDGGAPPLKLAKVVRDDADGGARLMEPLVRSPQRASAFERAWRSQGDLIQALQRCITMARRKEEGSGLQSQRLISPAETPNLWRKAQNELLELAARLGDAHLEDFGLDKTANFASTSAEGVRNARLAFCLLAVYEALFEFVWWHGEPLTKASSADRMHELFAKRAKLQDVLKEKNVTSAKKLDGADSPGKAAFARPAAQPLGQPQMRLKTLASIFDALCRDAENNHGEALEVISTDVRLVSWLFELTIDRLKLSKADLNFEGTRSLDQLRQLCGLMLELAEQRRQSVQTRMLSANPVFISQAVVVYSSVIDVASRGSSAQFRHILAALVDDGANRGGLADVAFYHYGHIVERVTALLARAQQRAVDADSPAEAQRRRRTANQTKDDVLRQVPPLLAVLKSLLECISTDEQRLRQVYQLSVERLCQAGAIGDVGVVRDIWRLVLAMQLRIGNSDCTELSTFARNVKYRLGLIFGDVTANLTIDAGSEIATISAQTAAAVAILLLRQVESWLGAAKCAFAHLKTQSKQRGEAAKQAELTKLLVGLTRALGELLITQLGADVLHSGLLRTVGAYFAMMTSLADYYASRCAADDERKSYTVHYKNLVLLAQRSIEPNIDAHITAAENVHDEADARTKKKVQVQRAARESRDVAELTRRRELYQNAIIKLSQKSGDDQLVKHQKLTQNRDFRINSRRVQQLCADQQNTPSDEDDEPMDAADDEAATSTSSVGSRRRRAPTDSDHSADQTDAPPPPPQPPPRKQPRARKTVGATKQRL